MLGCQDSWQAKMLILYSEVDTMNIKAEKNPYIHILYLTLKFLPLSLKTLIEINEIYLY